MTEELLVKRNHPNSKLPIRGTSRAAGLDVCACLEDGESVTPRPMENGVITLQPLERGLISTGLSMRPPEETYIRVAPRSGISFKAGMDVMAGVIDIDYSQGIAKVLLINLSDKPFEIRTGDKIAQIILERISMANAKEVDEIPATDRGAGGFGSTGK